MDKYVKENPQSNIETSFNGCSAADVALFVHGSWIPGQQVEWKKTYFCNKCGRVISIFIEDKSDGLKNYPYCHCGAKMDGGG